MTQEDPRDAEIIALRARVEELERALTPAVPSDTVQCGADWARGRDRTVVQSRPVSGVRHSRYDMNLDLDAFPGGRWDLAQVTADEVDNLIESQGGERRLDALLAIAEDAGVAADEVALIVKVGTQLVKQAVRAAKRAL